MSTVTTPNILEIGYLLDRHHRITNVTTQVGWPYGIEELAVTLEGENIDLDHANFLRHGEFRNLARLDMVFEAVQAAIGRKLEAIAVDRPSTVNTARGLPGLLGRLV
jgi:hypothetical protein